MIEFIIHQDSATGRFSIQGETHLKHSDHVHEIEVNAIWELIKDGRFEREAKTMLEKFCSERGLDSSKLLR